MLSAKDLRLRGLADPSRLREFRATVDAPLLVGSGLTATNGAQFADADGAIVGT